jgi:hypothetical protein
MIAAGVLFFSLLIMFLAVWIALSEGGPQVRLLTVSTTRREGDKLVVVIPSEKHPRLSFRYLTWGSSDAEIIYTSGSDQVQVRQRPSWRLTFDQEEFVYSISPPPTNNQTVMIEIILKEWLRFPPLSRFVRTNEYRWTKQF